MLKVQIHSVKLLLNRQENELLVNKEFQIMEEILVENEVHVSKVKLNKMTCIKYSRYVIFKTQNMNFRKNYIVQCS